MTATLWCELAWLGGPSAERGVTLELEGDRIAAVTPGEQPPRGTERLEGLTIPGLANVHSHAFQRGLRARTEAARGSFWTWREEMYALAEQLDPDSYLPLARATFAEMALAGITVVGEFHYLHHGPGGIPYEDPNAMGHAVAQAASEVGLRMTLIDSCYLHGGIGTPVEGAQVRFSDGSVDGWALRMDALAGMGSSGLRIGAAIHSVRAVDPDSAATVAAWAAAQGAPLHAHVSEQPAENEACQAAYRLTPVGLLERAGALSNRFTAVHATHVTGEDIAALGGASATCCLCPTTERNLADGIGPAATLRDAGARLALGSDSQAVIDLFEEARAVELDERLATGRRGHHGAAELLGAATAGGYGALGWPEGGQIAAGSLADLTTIRLDGVRLAGIPEDKLIEGIVHAGAASDVESVMVGGRWIVRDGLHVAIDAAAELRAALEQ